MPKLTPGAVAKPIEPSLLNRVVQGVRYMLTGQDPNQFFGPGQPVAPQAQDQMKARAFDFPAAFNTQRTPKYNEGTTFDQLRALADGYDLLRLAIEKRKDQMAKLKWSFKLKDPKAQPDARCEELMKFFTFPDQEHNWDQWLRMLLEELLVTDAATIYPRPNLGGGVFGLELVDGTTIKRVINNDGRTPLPPDVAYQQIIKGLPAVDYHRDELVYAPRNLRVNKLYGYSPVEQVIMTVNIALRRQIHQLQYYTEGNIPEALIGVPEEWNPDQIKAFQEYWDSILEGNTAQRRHAKFVPGGIAPTFTKQDTMKDLFDEWLARIVCWAFSLPPSALVKDTNRATAGSLHEQAQAEGLEPLMLWVMSTVNYTVWKFFGYDDVVFAWDEEDEIGPSEQMTVLTGYVTAKVMTPDEVREKIGLDPLTPEQQELLNPPPPPALGDDPGGGPPKPGQPKGQGGAAEPTGKYLGSALRKARGRKAKALSRNRKSVKASIGALTELIQPALTAMGKRITKEVQAKLADTGKAIQATGLAKTLLEELTFEELQDLAPELAEILEDMAADGGEAALAQVLADVTEDQLKQVNERAAQYAQERAGDLITDLSDSTRDMLRADITEAYEQGLSNDDIADMLDENYAFGEARAECIARTETAYADVQGNLEGYAASGVVDSKQWILAQDEYCDDCAALDGTIVALDEDFPDDGGDGPPLHPNCRCDVIPVLTEDTTDQPADEESDQ